MVKDLILFFVPLLISIGTFIYFSRKIRVDVQVHAIELYRETLEGRITLLEVVIKDLNAKLESANKHIEKCEESLANLKTTELEYMRKLIQQQIALDECMKKLEASKK